MFLQESSGNLLLEKQTHLKATRTQGEQVFRSQGLGWKRLSQSYPALFSGLAQLVPRAGVSGALWKPLVVHLSWEFLQHFGDAPSELGVNWGSPGSPDPWGGCREVLVELLGRTRLVTKPRAPKAGAVWVSQAAFERCHPVTARGKQCPSPCAPRARSILIPSSSSGSSAHFPPQQSSIPPRRQRMLQGGPGRILSRTNPTPALPWPGQHRASGSG